MKKQKPNKIVFFEKDVFFKFYLKKLFKRSDINIIFKNKIPIKSNADIFVISSDALEGFLRDEPSYPYMLVLNRQTNKFDLISKFSHPKKLYRGILRIFN